MIPKLSISKLAPVLALLACVFSVLFPNRDLRLCRSLSADVDKLRGEVSRLSGDLTQTVYWIRDELPNLVFSPPSTPEAVGDTSPAAPGVEVAGGQYMVARGVDGFTRGADWWVVGDTSPWGVVEKVYRGGFVADGVHHAFVQALSPSSSRSRSVNDEL